MSQIQLPAGAIPTRFSWVYIHIVGGFFAFPGLVLPRVETKFNISVLPTF